MNVEQHRWFSQSLGRDMEVRVYGRGGRALIVFPSQDGRVGDFEGFGMVDACGHLLHAGRLTLVTVDGNDWNSWTNRNASPADRARAHLDYDRYVVEEVFPFVLGQTGRETCWTTGCSMGAFHAANFFFRRPDLFDGVIGLSGLYDTRGFVGDFCDENVYFNSPLYYLPGLADPWYLDRYRKSRIVFAVGQGAYEEDCLRDTRALESVLAAKAVPAWFDYWGHDVNHDWPWWRRMLPYFLEKLGV
ncbi:MAG TPA: alpha/beta hydrolase-fold protein [Anaeromyxobacteraceae bacterium]|nr:alpha/beta hydrolase-fold protein [Anaeromyxobacteraceae bacterium]